MYNDRDFLEQNNKRSITHIPRSNYCYGYDENTLHIRLRAKKGEVKSAFLRIGDQYIWDELEGGEKPGSVESVDFKL